MQITMWYLGNHGLSWVIKSFGWVDKYCWDCSVADCSCLSRLTEDIHVVVHERALSVQQSAGHRCRCAGPEHNSARENFDNLLLYPNDAASFLWRERSSRVMRLTNLPAQLIYVSYCALAVRFVIKYEIRWRSFVFISLSHGVIVSFTRNHWKSSLTYLRGHSWMNGPDVGSPLRRTLSLY